MVALRLRIAVTIALASISAAPSVAQIIIDPNQLRNFHVETPEEKRKREEKAAEEQRQRAEAERLQKLKEEREKKEVVKDLQQRDWPSSRADEAKRLLALQKSIDEMNRKAGAQDSPPSPSAATKPVAATTPASRKGKNCRQVERPAKLAVGFADDKGTAQSKAMGKVPASCKTVSQDCFGSKRTELTKEGKPYLTGRVLYECRVSYSCGETREVCDTAPAAASAQ